MSTGPGTFATPAFHVMAKPAGALCNLDCEYCFFLTKEQLYPGATPRMSDETQESWIRQLLTAHRSKSEVTLAFQGGEPTLVGLDFYRRAVAVAARWTQPGQRVTFALQTNATLIDDAWGAFLAEHRFLVGVSIDGPRALHDAYRTDKGGKPTHERVLAGLAVLRQHGVEWNALTTVHAANAGHGLEVYRFLRDDCGARFMQFIPIVERATPETIAEREAGRAVRLRDRTMYTQDGDLVTGRSVTAAAYGQFLVEVFEEWRRHDIGTVYVQDIESALAHRMGRDDLGTCVHARTCGQQLALEHTGDVYSCDHFVEPGHRLGDVDTDDLLELVRSPAQVAFGTAKRTMLPVACRSCPVVADCNGGCPKDRFVAVDDGPPANYLCAGYRRFFEHLDRPLQQMAGLLGRQQPVTAMMRTSAQQDARRTPTAPCPCGSGRSWSRCHAVDKRRARPGVRPPH